ncbi:pre-rRNA-processing protein TSR2 homolog [Dromiciops gliroides]|uniref:pre-rRNA-processing protein TSR2 homolog n=1 Tax=Dromiciops gliroides TaxID=33562 RepID=UPI001CC6C266|nr:pre-rRNA-processing protein TSR2 homolog [Dromiciops gliroides]XP_043830294.1 pre-rRNA-processing protein TSR2 homolog [Dromiciops gliroides]XP_043830295.1 pre-rRNA-processing protein TSR2 homolog [Dromiciops gliroides]
MAASAEQAWTLFGAGVRAVLEAWPALQIAVENSFGGAHSRQKALWLGGVVEDYFIQNADLEQDEVEDFLADIMSTEFDTLVEDGSLPQVSQQLQTMFTYCRSGEEPLLREFITKMGKKQMEVKATEVRAVDQTKDSDSDQEERIDGEAEEMEVTDGMEVPAPPCGSQAGPSAATSLASVGHEATEDGWIVIQRKKK